MKNNNVSLTENSIWKMLMKKELNSWKHNDGTFNVGCRHPDFYNAGEKLVIELFGRNYHDAIHGIGFNIRVSPHMDEESTADHYRRCGWKCLVIWSFHRIESASCMINEFVGRVAPISIPIPVQTLADFIEPPSEARESAPVPTHENGKETPKDDAKPPTMPKEEKHVPPVPSWSYVDDDNDFDGQARKMY